jgi:transcriptional regulator with XRE-family HTH domain
VSRKDVARRTNWLFGPSLLTQIEKGLHLVDVAEIPTLARAYDIDLDDILPDRNGLEVDLRHCRIRVGTTKAKVASEASLDVLLAVYLEFVRELRGLPDDGWVDPRSLRIDDIVELALAADADPAEVERRLVEFLEATRPEGVTWESGCHDDLPPDQRPDLLW